eukprot:TRINITY_DN22743_c0_g1_i1.p1 TRINITY_DN22743_c0_g1~~TRINITY_DN22743_c0_g1_i1.p1  ORF type:complete len:626 (+),score=89.27 TRINITY_DN22743_c0_g1_i1:87-1880(+)
MEGLRSIGYSIGDKVMLFGLKKTEFQFLNGCSGRIIGFRKGPEGSPQVMVNLISRKSDQSYALKPQNVCHLSDDEEEAMRSTKPYVCTTASLNNALKCFIVIIISITLLTSVYRTLQPPQEPEVKLAVERRRIPTDPEAGITWLTETTRKGYQEAARQYEQLAGLEKEVGDLRDDIANDWQVFYPLNKSRIDETLIPFNSCRWVPTSLCSPYGAVLSRWGKICQTQVQMSIAGFCVCSNGAYYGKGCGGLSSRPFSCIEVCRAKEGHAADVVPKFPTKNELVTSYGPQSQKKQPSGVIVMVTKLHSPATVLNTLRNFEERVNKYTQYPYVIFVPPKKRLNPEFAAKMKASSKTTVSFITVSPKYWDHKNTSAENTVLEGVSQKVVDGHLENRFLLMHMHNHPAVLAYDYYIRLDDDVLFLCDLPYDPLRVLSAANKQFGFNMVNVVSHAGVSLLLTTIKDYRKEGDASIVKSFLGTKGEHKICGASPAFEVGSFTWLRGLKYNLIVKQLDDSLYFLRAVHPDSVTRTALASLLLKATEFHYFESAAVASAHDLYHIPTDPSFCTGELLPNKTHHNFNDHTHPCTKPHIHTAMLPSGT